jgi:hypothetical protein
MNLPPPVIERVNASSTRGAKIIEMLHQKGGVDDFDAKPEYLTKMCHQQGVGCQVRVGGRAINDKG